MNIVFIFGAELYAWLSIHQRSLHVYIVHRHCKWGVIISTDEVEDGTNN